MKKLPNEPDEPEQEGEGEIDIASYHTGGGWYEINGEKVQGKDNALELLEGDANDSED